VNLPKITAYIGSAEKDNQDEITLLVKTVKKKSRKNKSFYAVYMTFDLNNNQIVFEDPVPYTDELCYRYNYFGNNSAASAQYYLVREVDGLGYLLTTVWNDLLACLEHNGLAASDLADIIRDISKSGLILTGVNIHEGTVALEKIALFSEKEFRNFNFFAVDKKKKAVKAESLDKEKKITLKFEEIIRRSLGSTNKSNRFVLIVPAVKNSKGEKIILSTHPDYIKLVKIENNLDLKEVDENSIKSDKRICHVCHKPKTKVSSDYSKKFDRNGINKIFTTTTINSARGINKTGYKDNYAICINCYQNLKKGEKIIKDKFSGKIAEENAFIIPEGILDNFDYTCIYSIKENIDFAFNSREVGEWLKRIKADALFLQYSMYTVNIVIYRSDGNSITVLEVIEDIPTLRFTEIMAKLDKNIEKLKGHLKGMSISNIYRMIPVKKNKNNIQVDIGRVLSLYKALFSGTKIESRILFSYALEALDKGLKQLSKKKIDNYTNLGLYDFINGKEDFYIKKIVMSYLVLFKTCQQLGLLDFPIFQEKEVDGSMNAKNGDTEYNTNNTSSIINKMELFLDEQGFNTEARALFYLGALVNRVAVVQYVKNHKTKPVLKKINFQGMTQRDVLRLYEEVVEKLRQYNKMTLYNEHLMNKFHHYYGSLDKKGYLDEHANVFYIMAGYSYMVGNKTPDMTREEEQVLQEEQINQNEEQE